MRFSETRLLPLPTVIAFQYNPETVTREMTPWQPPSADGEQATTPQRAQPFDPAESFTVTLELDAADALEFPDENPVAVVAGVGDRISELEMLLYPEGDSILGGVVSALLPGLGTPVPRNAVPVVLFVWGPGRILPVRLTSFSVEEQAFSPTLYPIRAKVTVGLRVLTPRAFQQPGRRPTASELIAISAYRFTRAQREVLAKAKVVRTLESIVGALPV